MPTSFDLSFVPLQAIVRASAVLEITAAVIVIYLIRQYVLRPHRPRLPPGPKGWPLLGNIFDMPKTYLWLTFDQWGHEYGDIMSVTLLGQPLIIINSHKHAVDMLEKKSTIYSDRPKLMMSGELVGWANTTALIPDGPGHKEQRRMFHRLIGSRHHVAKFYDLETLETRKLLKRILREPERLQDHVSRTAGSTILRMAYGYHVKEGHDPFVDLVVLAAKQFGESMTPGSYMVDVLPWLRWVPQWFPGAGFKRKAAAWNKTLADMAYIPYNNVKNQLKAGTAVPSFTAELLEHETLDADKEYTIKWAAASVYSGGSDTTTATNYGFFLAMSLFPDIQRKAQAEIDRVVGTKRLPEYSDRDDLPYVDAIMKECLRISSVLPLGGMHRAMQDDIHDGCFIPKGATIITNIWRFLHDPEVYHDPMAFNPERFLGDHPESDPRERVFGYGRRICPGQYLADASIWLNCVMSLAVFDISQGDLKNATNLDRTISPMAFSGSPISHPIPFKCTIKPRSSDALALINTVDEDA